MSEDIPNYDSFFARNVRKIGYLVDGPVTFFRENFVEPMQNKGHYYHRNLRRIPGIEECYDGDWVCAREADLQFLRDKEVDSEIRGILKQRRIECELYYGADAYPVHCAQTKKDFEEASDNWFSRYGDLGAPHPGIARMAFTKQKHRMLWERRHGTIGTGMNKTES